MQGRTDDRWKKQIFTEAEMLAEAAGETDKVVEALPSPELLKVEVESDDVFERTRPPSTVHELDESKVSEGSSRSAANTPVEDRAGAEQEGFDVGKAASTKADSLVGDASPSEDAARPSEDQENPAPAVVLPGKSFADAVKPHAPETVSSAPTTDKAKSKVAEPSGTPFPALPRLPSSVSQHSFVSQTSNTDTSPRPPTIDLPSDAKSDKDKGRKRLKSIKGFVRRISDQGAGLTRSPSFKGTTGGTDDTTPTKGTDEAGTTGSGPSGPQTPDGERKKRFSFQKKP
jgi:hypothetical protein